MANILITEVNSNATGGDFFELYNYGTTAIDLSGWRWTDEAASFASATAVFPSGTTLAAGARLLVVSQTTDATAFKTAWGLSDNAHVLALGGPGLGKQDAVVVFNASGAVTAAFNYDTDSVTASDGTVIATTAAAAGSTFSDNQHAGTAYNGGTLVDKFSAVWDGVSTASPAYKAAAAGTLGGYAQTGDAASVGSPDGGYSLLITEVNSSAGPADFFELYNHGSAAIDLTGWKWDDDSANPADAAAVALSGTIQPGERLVVVAGTDAAAFRAAWGLDGSVPVLATGGPGLGGGDAVVVFDQRGNVAAGVNFKTSPVTAPDGTVIAPMVRSDGQALTTAHAGLAVGGTATQSAVWDGISTRAPQYDNAAVGVLGALAQSGNSANIGSPGTVVLVTTPAVNLSVSAATGTEAGATVITVTATASAEVSGDQTLTVGVSGTGITVGDYTLSSTTLTIANGATTGTVSFTVVDDAVLESTETATVSISNPSAGIILGGTTSQTISITDNEAAGALNYSGAFNEGLAFDGSVSGKVIITLTGGETFTGNDGDQFSVGQVAITNVPGGLTAVLIRTSPTTAELSFTGTATSHSSDVGNVAVTFANSAFTGGSAAAVTGFSKTDLHIDFADTGANRSEQTHTPNPGTTAGSSDTSSAVALDANWMIVADNEGNVLRVHARAGGDAVAEWSYASISPLLSAQADIEGSVRIGDTIYFTGSHSNKSGGDEADNREIVFSVNVSGTGAATQFSLNNSTMALEAAFVAWDSSNAHGLGANHFGFAAGSAHGVPSEVIHGFNIEGLTASADGSMLMFAMRAPLVGTDEKAVIFTVQTSSIFSGSPVFGAPVELDLDGRGIREIRLASDGSGYLIVAGPAAGESTEVTNDFRLYRWDGSGQPVELDTELDSLLAASGGSFESIVDVQSTASGTLVQLLQDNGDTVWSGQTLVSKDLPASQQKFLGNWVQLGNAVTDSTGPVLASSSPADNAAGAQAGANLVLHFDEGVLAGSGSFVIRNAADGSVVETIAANSSQVTVDYNTVTINPGSDLTGGASYYLQTTGSAVVDHNGNAWGGIGNASTLNFTVATPPTTLAAGDLLFVAANADSTDAFAFVLFKGVTAGTAIGFTDRNYSGTSGMPTSGESAYLWTADQDYAAGTVVTIRPDVASGNPLADKGSVQGMGGGLSSTAETIYAFQGSIAGLGDGAAGAITVDSLLASLNFGGAAAGDVPSAISTASLSLGQDNVKYTGWLDTTDLASLRSLITNPANWTTSDTVSFGLTSGSLFPSAPAPVLTEASADGASVMLTFSEMLDAVNTPLLSAFGIRINGGAAVAPTALSMDGNQIILTLGTPVRHGQTVTIDHADTTPGRDDGSALQDEAGNDAASFSGVAVTNNTPNSAPTGTVAISGTASLGQTLTASNTLADADGLGTIAYQWLRGGVAISGATASTYTLGSSDLNQFISVRASYTDGGGTAETQASASVQVAGYTHTAVENTKTVGTISVSDSLLGSAPKYTLSGADAALFKITSKGVLTFAAAPDHEVPTDANHDGAYSVSVTLTNSKTSYAVTQNLLVGVSFAAIEGTGAADTLKGTKGRDTLDGKADSDKLTGGDGLDTFLISAGTDTITDFNALGKTATGQEVLQVANGASVTATVKAAWTATSASHNQGDATLITSGLSIDLSGITSGDGWILTNKGKATTLIGSLFDDRLNGGSGSDSLIGGAGNDTLAGGKGSDVLTGGADADTFRFGGDSKTDHITDFVSGTDHIELDNALFKVLGEGGLPDAQFGLGTVATTASQRLVYDSTSGNLWYDADGSGKTKAVLIGVLDNHATLTAADVLVV